MVKWNPVEGMRELTWDELRVGDEVVQLSFGEHYHRTTIEDPKFHGTNSKYYLLNREEPKEPEGRGDLAEIYLKDNGSGEETVEMYVRTRPKFSDGNFSNEQAWTDEANNVTRFWRNILNRVADNKDYAIRTYTASYKEN